MSATRWRYSRLSTRAEGAIAAHREACIARRHSTEPADCERVERGIADGYRFTGREPPKNIVWVDSPASLVAGPLAAGIIQCWSDGSFKPKGGFVAEAIAECVRPYIYKSVPETVIDVVRTAVGVEFDPSTAGDGAPIQFAVGDANHTIELRNACGKAVSKSVRDALGYRLYERLLAELDRHRDHSAYLDRSPCCVPLHDANEHAQMAKRLPQPLELDSSLHRTWSYVLSGRAEGPHEGDRWLTSFVRDVIGTAHVRVSDEMWRRSRAFDDLMSAGELWPHRGFCLVSHPPVTLHVEVALNEFGYPRWHLHNAAGPAVVWRDGTAQWYLNDDYIGSAYWNENPPQSWLTVDRITTMTNVEKRRELVERYGRNRYLRDARAARIDVEHPPSDSEWASPLDMRYRALWLLDQHEDEPIVVVDVINQSPEPFGTEADGESYLAIGGRVWRRYMLRVPPTMRSCSEAVAWTFGKTAATYAPGFEA